MRPSLSLLPLLLAACGDGGASPILATRADSAGIEIVTNSAPAWPEGGGWRIEPEPILQIGHRADDDPRYDLFRVGNVRALPGGGIIAVVAGHSEMRIFDADGNWVQSIGRAGDGPGEIRNPGSLNIAGDSIFLVDVGLGRTNLYRINGDFVESMPYPVTPDGRRIRPVWRMADGRWVGATEVPTPGQTTEGHYRDSVEYHLIAGALDRVEGRLAAVPGPEMYGRTTNAGDGRLMSMRMMLPLARGSTARTDGSRLIIGENSRPQLDRYAASGSLESIIRWAAPRIPVDAGLLDRMKSARLREVTGNAAAEQSIAAQFDTPGLADAVPYFTTIHVDATGSIWLQEYPIFTGDSLRFTIFDTTGQWLGRLALPPRHTLQAITADRLYTVWRDDDDLEFIRVYRIRR